MSPTLIYTPFAFNPLVRVAPFEFRRNLRHQKRFTAALLSAIVYTILFSRITSVYYRLVTDRQTDGRTARGRNTASRGKS